MEYKTEINRIVGLAKIVSFEVTFESVSYVISLRECMLETSDQVKEIPDYQISMDITFNDANSLLNWLRTQAFTAMQKSFQSGEDNCYFEHSLSDRAALMSLNGAAAVIPVRNQ